MQRKQMVIAFYFFMLGVGMRNTESFNHPIRFYIAVHIHTKAVRKDLPTFINIPV